MSHRYRSSRGSLELWLSPRVPHCLSSHSDVRCVMCVGPVWLSCHTRRVPSVTNTVWPWPSALRRCSRASLQCVSRTSSGHKQRTASVHATCDQRLTHARTSKFVRGSTVQSEVEVSWAARTALRSGACCGPAAALKPIGAAGCGTAALRVSSRLCPITCVRQQPDTLSRMPPHTVHP